MKTLLTITIFVFTVMFSSTSIAGWTKVSKSVSGNTFYLDFERIRKVDGFVYYWTLTDYLKSTNQGHLSGKVYNQGDCKLFRYKYLSDSYHTQPMGMGIPSTSSNEPDKEWYYPPPNSSNEKMLKSVCSR